MKVLEDNIGKYPNSEHKLTTLKFKLWKEKSTEGKRYLQHV